MPYFSLFDFGGVKNIRVKVTLGRVKNSRESAQNLHSPFFGPFYIKISAFWYTSVHQRPATPTFDFHPQG
jgi:hypothetical protein